MRKDKTKRVQKTRFMPRYKLVFADFSAKVR